MKRLMMTVCAVLALAFAATPKDFYVYPDVRDGTIDIGCYECWLPIPGMLLLFR